MIITCAQPRREGRYFCFEYAVLCSSAEVLKDCWLVPGSWWSPSSSSSWIVRVRTVCYLLDLNLCVWNFAVSWYGVFVWFFGVLCCSFYFFDSSMGVPVPTYGFVYVILGGLIKIAGCLVMNFIPSL